LPEETLYLMEKGALFCWKASREPEDNDAPGEDETEDKDAEWDSASQGAPMSVQQAYAEMIGREALTLDRYQVCEPSYLILILSYTLLESNLFQRFSNSSPPLLENKITIKDFRLPSPPGLHRDSSEASVPRLSHSCSVPTSPAAVSLVHHGIFDFPQGARNALLACTQIPELVSSAVDDVVAASRTSAMAQP
jgi:hypothetical protein